MAEISEISLIDDANLLAYYKFNSGALTTDSSGNSRTLTNNNTVGETSGGKYGYAADFGDPNTNKTFSRAEDIWNAGNFSAVGWMKTADTAGTHEFFDFADETTDRQLALLHGGTTFTARHVRVGVATDSASGTITVVANKWHHVALTLAGSGGTLKAYFDGQEVASAATVDANGTVGQPEQYRIGRGPGGSEMEGLMDDVAFFNRVLTPAEIEQIYKDAFKSYSFFM